MSGEHDSDRPEEAAADRLHLTTYVTTRWYRAPEIAVEANLYDFSADVWSAGCIMAEMILRQPLLPGKDWKDQLTRIVKLLGIDEEDVAAIGHPVAVRFIRRCSPPPRQSWTSICPNASKTKLEADPAQAVFLDSVLCFARARRITAREATLAPLFEEIHDEPQHNPEELVLAELPRDPKKIREALLREAMGESFDNA